MARTNPIGKIKDLASETLKAPKTVAGKAAEQAMGAVAGGKSVADRLARTAGSVVSHVPGVGSSPAAKAAEPTPAPVQKAQQVQQATQKATAKVTEKVAEKVADQPATPAPVKKAADKVATKAAEKPAPKTAEKPAAKAADKPAKKSAAKPPAPAPEVDTSEPVNIVQELGLDPAPVDKPQGEQTPAAEVDVDVTPADIAPKAKQPAAQKQAAKKPAAKKPAAKKPAAEPTKPAPGAKLPPRAS